MIVKEGSVFMTSHFRKKQIRGYNLRDNFGSNFVLNFGDNLRYNSVDNFGDSFEVGNNFKEKIGRN